MPLQIRRGTEAERQAMTVPLAVGEPLFVTDTGSIYVGNGTSPGGVQVTGLTIEDSVDAVAAALVAGVNQNVTFVYGTAQDQANRIDCRLDLSTVEGTIDADGFKGPLLADDSGVIVNSANRNITANDISANAISASNLTITGALISSSIVSDLKGSVFGDDSTVLINALESSINLDQTIKSNVIPGFDDLIDLGSPGSKFSSLHLGAEGLYIDGAQIQATLSGAIDLPAGSTIGGTAIAGEGLVSGSNYNINIVDDSSTLIVDSSAGVVNANTIGFHIGDVKGSVFADDSSTLVDSVSGLILGNVRNIETDTSRVAISGIVNSLNIDASGFTLSINNALEGFYGPTGIGIISDLGPSSEAEMFRILTHHNDTDAHNVLFYRSKGTAIAPSALVAGDNIFDILFVARAATGDSQAAVMRVSVDPNGTVGSTVTPGKIEFQTSNDDGIIETKFSIDKDGVIDIFDNTTTAGSNPGEVDLATSTVAESWLRVKVGGVEYALPLYAINP